MVYLLLKTAENQAVVVGALNRISSSVTDHKIAKQALGYKALWKTEKSKIGFFPTILLSTPFIQLQIFFVKFQYDNLYHYYEAKSRPSQRPYKKTNYFDYFWLNIRLTYKYLRTCQYFFTRNISILISLFLLSDYRYSTEPRLQYLVISNIRVIQSQNKELLVLSNKVLVNNRH